MEVLNKMKGLPNTGLKLVLSSVGPGIDFWTYQSGPGIWVGGVERG